MKDRVLKIVQSAVRGSKDNLIRANRNFRDMTEVELDQQYGRSGGTCREAWDKYKRIHAENQACVEWVESK